VMPTAAGSRFNARSNKPRHGDCAAVPRRSDPDR
jgi:hypothetical protein